jgi:hypothetical protein
LSDPDSCWHNRYTYWIWTQWFVKKNKIKSANIKSVNECLKYIKKIKQQKALKQRKASLVSRFWWAILSMQTHVEI